VPAPAYTPLTTIRPVWMDELPATFAVSVSPAFADGGREFNLDADQKIRRWVIQYAGLTQAEAATLDAHVEATRYYPDGGSAYGFNFTDRDNVTHANVRYDAGGYERNHTKVWSQSRTVRLVKYP
jgi:hypothetical protein